MSQSNKSITSLDTALNPIYRVLRCECPIEERTLCLLLTGGIRPIRQSGVELHTKQSAVDTSALHCPLRLFFMHCCQFTGNVGFQLYLELGHAMV